MDGFTGQRQKSDARYEFDLKLVLKSLRFKQRYLLQPFLLHTFETTGRNLIVFVRLIFGKVGVDGYTGTRRESDFRYECDLKIELKRLGSK